VKTCGFDASGWVTIRFSRRTLLHGVRYIFTSGTSPGSYSCFMLSSCLAIPLRIQRTVLTGSELHVAEMIRVHTAPAAILRVA